MFELKRFNYDWNTYEIINDNRFTFPNVVDMSRYAPDATENLLYGLHGIVEYQRGFYSGGYAHYVYYVKSYEKEKQGEYII